MRKKVVRKKVEGRKKGKEGMEVEGSRRKWKEGRIFHLPIHPSFLPSFFSFHPSIFLFSFRPSIILSTHHSFHIPIHRSFLPFFSFHPSFHLSFSFHLSLLLPSVPLLCRSTRTSFHLPAFLPARPPCLPYSLPAYPSASLPALSVRLSSVPPVRQFALPSHTIPRSHRPWFFALLSVRPSVRLPFRRIQ